MKLKDLVHISSLNTDEERQFRTFANYVASIALIFRARYNSSANLVTVLRDRLPETPALTNLDHEKTW